MRSTRSCLTMTLTWSATWPTTLTGDGDVEVDATVDSRPVEERDRTSLTVRRVANAVMSVALALRGHARAASIRLKLSSPRSRLTGRRNNNAECRRQSRAWYARRVGQATKTAEAALRAVTES